MNQAVKDGIGQGRITDGFMPVFEWKLAGNQGRSTIMSVFKNFEYIPAMAIIELRQSPIV